MKTLHLPLKKEWYEMIERGEKREEYREFTPYWIARLMEWYCWDTWEGLIINKIRECEAVKIFNDYDKLKYRLDWKYFDAVCFSYGYTKRRMLWECKDIKIGCGRPEWGAPAHKTFIIKLGKRLGDDL